MLIGNRVTNYLLFGAIVLMPLAATAQTVRVDVEAGVQFPGGSGYLFKNSDVPRQPPLIDPFGLTPVVPVVGAQVHIGSHFGVRIGADWQRTTTATNTYPRPSGVSPVFDTYTSRIDVDANYRSLSLQPVVGLGVFGRVRPWLGAGEALRRFHEEQTTQTVVSATGQAGVPYSETRDVTEHAVLVSGGARVALSRRAFAGGALDWRLHRESAAMSPDTAPRSPRLTVSATVGVGF